MTSSFDEAALTPLPPLPCFLYEVDGTDFTYPFADTDTIISSSSIRSSIETSPTSGTILDLLSSPNLSVIASSSSIKILSCFARLFKIEVSSLIVSFRSFFSSSSFSISSAVSLLSGISNM